MPTEHWAELRQAVEATFQGEALGVAFHCAPKQFNLTPGCKPIQFFIVAKEIIWVSLNVPNPLH